MLLFPMKLISIFCLILSLLLTFPETGGSVPRQFFLAVPGETFLQSVSLSDGMFPGEQKLYDERIELLGKVWPRLSRRLRLFITTPMESQKIVQVFLGMTSGCIVEHSAKFKSDSLKPESGYCS